MKFCHRDQPVATVFLFVFLFTFPSFSVLWAQGEEPSLSQGPKVEARASSEGRITIDFRDALLPEVLKVLSSLSGVSFVTAEDASTKKINLFLENVTFEDALKAVIKGNGLAAQKVSEENIYMVRLATGDDALIPLETRVFKLKYVRVAKVKEVSVSESSTSGGSSSGSSSSSIGGSSSIAGAVSASGGEPTEIKRTIEDLLSPRGKVTINDRTNSLIITDISERLDEIAKVIQLLDKPLDQVLIEAIMLESALNFNRRIGTEWGTDNASGTDTSLGTVSGARGSFSIPFINQAGDLLDRGSLLDEDMGLSFGSFDFSQLQATLRALQTDNRTKILAKPRLLVLDNEPAFIKITVNAVIAQNTQIATGSSAPVQSTSNERTEVGVTLKVTPLINDDHTITLTLEPRFSTLETAQFASTLLDPRIRASRTTLCVEDGHVVVISGLLQRDQTKIRRKLPILGDIPFFGWFFSKWTTQKVDRDLMIFLRPQIIRRGDSSLIRARTIPDEMTTVEEEAAEFWKVWEKPWFKDMREKISESKEAVGNDPQAFDEAKNRAIEKAFQSFKGDHISERPMPSLAATETGVPEESAEEDETVSAPPSASAESTQEPPILSPTPANPV